MNAKSLFCNQTAEDDQGGGEFRGIHDGFVGRISNGWMTG
jgi:hypothetical protein